MFDFFSSFFPDYSEAPSIGGISADVTSVDNLLSGNATGADYGRGIGAGVGAYFGQPQLGADIGARALPALGNAWHSIWDSLSK